jgi:hypothetical protein
MTPDRRRTAIHEAGHAVVRWAIDGTTGEVLLDPPEADKAGKAAVPLLPPSLLDGTTPMPKPSYTDWEECAIENYIRRALAGAAAEQELDGSRDSIEAVLDRTDGSDSFGIARRYWPNDYDGADRRVERLVPGVREIVETHWDRIERIAAALEKTGSLDEPTVRRLIEGS